MFLFLSQVIPITALALTGANVVGYVKCRKDAGAKLTAMAGQFIGHQLLKQVCSVIYLAPWCMTGSGYCRKHTPPPPPPHTHISLSLCTVYVCACCALPYIQHLYLTKAGSLCILSCPHATIVLVSNALQSCHYCNHPCRWMPNISTGLLALCHFRPVAAVLFWGGI